MQIYKEIALRKFKPWLGAKAVFYRFTFEELKTIEDVLTEVKETWSETEINDTFWFNDDWLLETLGIDKDEFWKREEAPF